ncbi:Rhs family protein [Candidatus Moduliflexus flocculans]|uniref:Rhs family protein n=1 Tax=Candidatus Moduliflexus flocculans TaxID=1499966 RepID=A0A081BSZ5_9BACT|nr:Rhs family protein [Candidatus Moduliflexus flocculans]
MGSIRGLSDAAGNITDSYAYDAYGMLLHQTGATANPYLYRGEPFDADLSAYYLRARSYQAATGRFLKRRNSL